MCQDSLNNGSILEDTNGTWDHLTFGFLRKEKLMDSSKRPFNHPDYNSGTLHVPKEFLAKLSPGLRQWWGLKSKYADVILLFKVGKFYELYHMDAVICVEHLGLVFMKGSHAHCGFPEIAFDRMADALVNKGFKVGRVEQTETVEAMTERTKGRPGSEKVVRREVCQLLTPGTCTASMRVGLSSSPTDTDDSDQFRNVTDQTDSYLIAIAEGKMPSNNEFLFGVSLLNATQGQLKVLVERGLTCMTIKGLFKTCLSGVPVEYLTRGKQFWSAKETIEELETANYFHKLIKNEESVEFTGKENWPCSLLTMLDTNDPLGRTVKPEFELAVSCLGAITSYLRYCLIDHEVLSLGSIQAYNPPDFSEADDPSPTIYRPFYSKQSSLVLDSITLANLDILYNRSTGTREGTLLERLDTCCTPFGRRLLRQWVTAPPCNPNTICERQESVENLIELSSQLTEVKDSLRRLPDLERLLTKIHLLGSRGNNRDHPDNRAILYEDVQYSRRNIVDFVATLNGFEVALAMLELFKPLQIKSGLLKSLTSSEEHGGRFPALLGIISEFKRAFDADKAKQEGRITPEQGTDKGYDQANIDVEEIKTKLNEYLVTCSQRIGVRLSYWGTGRNRYQLEVPDSAVKKVPSNWQLASQRKGVKRYRSSEILDWFAELTSAEERKDTCLRYVMHTIFASFSDNFTQWHEAIRCLAELDGLIALAVYSMNASSVTCLPEFVYLTEETQKPSLEIVDGLHPCLINAISDGDLIANDIRLGSSEMAPLVVLVTGPNMGGKSTLMRQTALLVILAHLGCRIPASSCRLTPIDRVFSRLGASDRLLAGESTFMVEMSETAAILRHITSHSLVLMDELGRGTSTHDGASLAGAVLRYLVHPVAAPRRMLCGPRTLFSTHYHNVVDEVNAGCVSTSTPIGLGHMACMVEEQSDNEAGLENITFLYKFVTGACPKSYGFNAARLAHLPDEVIQMGMKKAKEFERTAITFACARALMNGTLNPREAGEWKAKLAVFV